MVLFAPVIYIVQFECFRYFLSSMVMSFKSKPVNKEKQRKTNSINKHPPQKKKKKEKEEERKINSCVGSERGRGEGGCEGEK